MSRGNNDEIAASECDDGVQPLLAGARTSSSRYFIALDVKEDEREVMKQRLKWIVRRKDLKALNDLGGLQVAEDTFLPSEPQGTANDGLMEVSIASVPNRRSWDFIFLFSKEFWYSVWMSFNSWPIFLLLIAAGLTLAIESLEQGLKEGWHDGVGILIAVFLLLFFPSFFDFYRGRVEAKKLKIKNKFEVIVERSESKQIVSVSDVKEGDIIHLKKGDRIPADGLLIRGNYLIVDEVIKPKIDTDRNPFLYLGSVVEYGDGVMIAVSTGADVVFGKALIDVTSHPSEETFLQSLINKPYEFVGMFSLILTIIILVVILARCISGEHDRYYNDKLATKGKVTVGIMENVLEKTFLKFRWEVSFLLTALLTMVIGIQHGIPFAISVSLFWWGEKIRRSHGARSQNLSANATLGCVKVMCIDITSAGGLSCDEVEVDQLWIGEEKIYHGMEFHPDILELFELAVLRFYSKTSVDLWNNLLCFWNKLGFKIIESLEQKFDIDPSKTGNFEANLPLRFNGDALTVLDMCSQYYDIRGIIHDMGKDKRDFFEKAINGMTIEGLRPVAFACEQASHQQQLEGGGLKLLGFVGLKYSFENIKMSLKDLKDVGVRIIFISEDEISKATAMAVDFGIQCYSHNQVIEGEEFRKANSTEMEKNELMKSITLMGNATSEDKLLLLQELKASGHVVAFLGGKTTTDAPCLREADVGIAEENWSTEVCRTASDITVELITSLNEILRCGRCIYLNIQKCYQIQFTASISGLLLILVFNMVSGKSPITSIHLLWVTLIMCPLGILMMVMKLNDEEVNIPLEVNRFIPILIVKRIATHVLYQVLVFLVLEYIGQKIIPHMEEDVRHTIIFNTFILWQIFNLVAAMGLVTKGEVVFKAMMQSRWFVVSLVCVLTVEVMVIELAPKIVNGGKLGGVKWGICCIVASLPLTVEWAKNKFLPVLASLFFSADVRRLTIIWFPFDLIGV